MSELQLSTTKTQRGFDKITFEDRYGEPCKIQKSSLATEDAIWFGTEKPRLMMMAKDGQEDGVGWVNIPLHEKVHIMGDSMHLTRSQVEALLPILQKFVETGEIK